MLFELSLFNLKKNFKPNNSSGFTLVELLVVIGVIIALSGVTLAIIRPQEVNDKASDGVRMANMEKIVTGIEAFELAEGYLPVTGNHATFVSEEYLKAWPDGDPTGTTYLYSSDGTTFGLVVETSLGTFYKYRPSYPRIQECANGNPAEDGC